MADNGKLFWTPDGIQRFGGETSPDRVELRPGVGEWLVQFADVAEALQIGLHCRKCGNPLVGKNARTDTVFSQSCGCRDFVWKNRDSRPVPRSQVQ